MRRNRKILAVAAAIGALLLFAAWFLTAHVFVGGKPYAKHAKVHDFQGQTLTAAEYEALCARFPEADILWDVPLSEKACPNQSRELALTSLTDSDLPLLKYFPVLQTIHAEGCRDYPQLAAAAEDYPRLEIRYNVTIGGQNYPHDTKSLSLSQLSPEEAALLRYLPNLTHITISGTAAPELLDAVCQARPDCELTYSIAIGEETVSADAAALNLNNTDPRLLLEALQYLPDVTQVTLTDPIPDGESLSALYERYPHISFFWEMKVHGVTVTTDDTEADFSEAEFESTDTIEAAMACFPNVKTVYLGECGIDNDELAAYRHRVREDYKVVWLLKLGLMPVRTDATSFMPGRPSDRYYVDDATIHLLRYCEDMICVDIGHYPITSCQWAASMPRLKYLILSDTRVNDISPLVGLKELVFLEMFGGEPEDFTPLLQLTALEDLNLCLAESAHPEVVLQMTWLKRLWWNGAPFSEAQLQKALPDTEVKCRQGSSTAYGWREGQHYYDMRDLLEMPYFTW